MSSWRASVSTVSGAPSWVMVPPSPSTIMRSMCGAQMLTRCSTTSRVAPVACAAVRMLSRTSCTPEGSRLAVGSSRIMAPGCIERMPARPRRCFCPPDSALLGWSRGRLLSPTAVRASVTRPQISSRGTRRFSGPKATSLPTVAMTMEDSGSCCIMPAVPRASAGDCPLMVMVPPADSPSSSWSTPAMACRSVDLPAPEVPSSRTFSPGLMVRLSPLMTGSGRPGWCQLKLLSSMRAPRGVASMMVP